MHNETSQTNKNQQKMKKFSLRGNTANWSALKVEALNTNTEERETSSAIPYGHKVVVRVVNNFYRVYDKNVRQILHGEISTEDNAFILARLTKARRPDFVLFHDGKVIGIANIHRRRWYREATTPKDYHFNVTLDCKVKVTALNREEAIAKIHEAVENVNANNITEDTSDFSVVDIVDAE